jgi:hypothetical protein
MRSPKIERRPQQRSIDLYSYSACAQLKTKSQAKLELSGRSCEACDLTEVWLAEISIGNSIVHDVEQIVQFSAEVEVHPFPDLDDFRESKVGVQDSFAPERVSTHISKRKWGGRGKGCRIDPHLRGAMRRIGIAN